MKSRASVVFYLPFQEKSLPFWEKYDTDPGEMRYDNRRKCPILSLPAEEKSGRWKGKSDTKKGYPIPEKVISNTFLGQIGTG